MNFWLLPYVPGKNVHIWILITVTFFLMDNFPYYTWNIQLQLTIPGNFSNWEPNFLVGVELDCGGFTLPTFHLSFTYQFRLNFFINFLDRVKNEFFRCRIRFDQQFLCFDSYSSLHPKSQTSHFGNPSKILQEIEILNTKKIFFLCKL